MRPTDRERFGPTQATLKDGRTITVRMLLCGDGPAIAEFYSAIPREDYRFYCPWPLTARSAQDKVAGRADADNFVCVIGVDGQRIVGYAWYDWKDDSSDSSGFGICVRRGHQGNGTGRAIMQRLFEVAQQVGPPRMHLTVQNANARATALYQKMGFRIVRQQMRGQVEEFPPEPEYLMERPAR